MLIIGHHCPSPLIHAELFDCPAAHIAHARLAVRFETTFLLESREGPERLAQYSFLGWDPVGLVRLDQSGLTVEGALPKVPTDQEPLEYMRNLHAVYAVDDHDTPFVGGLVGCVGYDFVRNLEPTLEHDVPESWPRFLFGLYLDGVVFDHRNQTVTYVSRGPDRRQDFLDAMAAGDASRELKVGRLTSSVNQTTYERQVSEARGLIAAGEAFQIVLSRMFSGPYEGSLMPLYAWLRDAAAVPYLYHMRFGGPTPRHLLGASPEGLVRVRKGTVDTFPIAGTRPVTGDAAADAAAGQSLKADPKETAEHAMLVDLARNDIGRVCRHGSVQVAEYQELHQFRVVQHLVSRVTGELADGQDAWSALAAVFPAGTVSGAPKVRAMEHIDAIESTATIPRGPYAGAVCYASFNGDFDSAIAIRSLSAENGRVQVQAGAGIVYHSNPTAEWNETRHKAQTILSALEAFGAEVDA
jgi:anthranilate synthase component 1